MFSKVVTIEVEVTQEENSNEQRMVGNTKSHSQQTGTKRNLRAEEKPAWQKAVKEHWEM